MHSVPRPCGRIANLTGLIRGAIVAAVFAMPLGNQLFGQQPRNAQRIPASGENVAMEQQIEEKKQAIYDLQQKLIPLLRRAHDDPKARVEAENLQNEIAFLSQALGALSQKLYKDPAMPGLEPLQPSAMEELTQARKMLALREQQIAEMQQALAKLDRDRNLPPLEGAQVKGYRLSFAPAREIAQAVESVFGAQAVRVASDDRTNAVVVFAKAQTIPAIDALVDQLDKYGRVDDSGNVPSSPPPLMLRLFWLADGLPESEGQEAHLYLPNSVLAATEKLGLMAPRLVTQTVNSLAVGVEEPVEFSTNVPAILLNQPASLACMGHLKLVQDNRVGLEMEVHVGACDLKGSLAMPLGHYMVLGTANSVIADAATVARMGGGGMGMAGRGEFGPEGHGRFRGAMPADGAGAAEQQPAEPQFNTSRFAFVVQVVEGESYTADAAESGDVAQP